MFKKIWDFILKAILVAFFIVTGIALLWKLAYGATIPAHTNFLITQKAPNNTSIYTSWTIPANLVTAPPDSLNIVWFSGSDTLFSIGPTYLGVGGLLTTSTSWTLTGLTPHTQYILAMRARRGDSTVISNKDTMYTAYPEIEEKANVNQSEWVYGAKTWLPSTITYDSLYVTADSGLDSTMVYWTAPYVSLQAKAIGNADSCKVLLYVFNGHAEQINTLREGAITTGQWNFINTYADTMNITVAGWTKPKLLNIDSGDHFYARADGQTGNGKTWLLLRLFRRDQ